MAIKFKFARIADNINNTESEESEKEGQRKADVRPVLLSDKTLDMEDLVKLIIQRHPQLGAQAFLSVEVVLEALKKALQDGNIIHLKDFGQFSLNAQFRKHSMGKKDETSRANSLEIKSVVFKADKALKQEIERAGFVKYNPEKHGVRKY